LAPINPVLQSQTKIKGATLANWKGMG